MEMAFKMLLVLLAMLLTSGTERSKEVSTRGRRLCLCSNRVLRLSSLDRETSSFVSCEERCMTDSNAGVPRRPRRSSRDVLEEAEKCRIAKVNKDIDCEVKNKKVTFHESGSSSEWYAQVSWSPFTGSSHPWIGYYIVYVTGDLPPGGPTYCLFISKNQTSVNITSSEEKEIIDLIVIALPESLNSSVNDEYIRLSRYARNKTYLGAMTPAWYKPTEDKITVTTYVSIIVGILAGVVLGAGLLKYCLYRKNSSYFPPEYKFHAFIIYQKEDSYWVSKELLPFLEEKHHIKCCIHYRDFTPGLPFLDSMAESVYKSYKIIAVFSSNFLQSNYCTHELDLAQYRLLNRRDDCLIIIRIDKTDPSNLPPALQKRNFIDYADALERPFWKGRLLKFLNSGSQGVSKEQDNNNSTPEGSNVQNGHSQRRVQFDRLNSTISTATEISIVSLNEERLI